MKACIKKRLNGNRAINFHQKDFPLEKYDNSFFIYRII